MASGKRNARLNKSLFKQFKQEKGVDVEEVEEDLSDEDDQQWTKEETILLMSLIKTQLKERDTYSYIRRIQLLDWDQVRQRGSINHLPTNMLMKFFLPAENRWKIG